MNKEDMRTIREALELQDMMYCAYHEIWRRREAAGSDEPITAQSVAAIYDDVQHCRGAVSSIETDDMNELHMHVALSCELDATFRTLYAAALGYRRHHKPRDSKAFL